VNFTDLLRVAQNYDLSPREWWQGNFTYDDNIVNFTDLLRLAQNYGQSLAVARVQPVPHQLQRNILNSEEDDELWT
jgi:hypothetical protein